MNQFGIFLRLAVIIFAVEAVVMVGLEFIPIHDRPVLEMLVDSAALVTLSAPFIFYWVLLPWVRADRERTKHAIEAEASNKAKSAFLAAMSHEIRTPMNGILGLVDVVLEGDLESQQRDYIGMVKKSAKSLMNILNDILDLSKIEVERMQIVNEPMVVHQLVSDIAALWQSTIESKGLTFDVKLEGDLENMVRGDCTRIGQVLSNLLSNAVKFTKEGTIGLTASATEFEDWTLFQFEISDTGIGLTPEQQARIFEPFVQAE